VTKAVGDGGAVIARNDDRFPLPALSQSQTRKCPNADTIIAASAGVRRAQGILLEDLFSLDGA